MVDAGPQVGLETKGRGVEPRYLDLLASQAERLRGHALELIDSWRSPKATFFRYRVGPAGRTFIVKAGANWGPGDAETVFSELRRVRALLLPVGVLVPEPLGFVSHPPLLAMEDVTGESLIKVALPARTYLHWPDGAQKVEDLAALCGRALAQYHAAEPSPQTASVEAAVRADIRRAALRGFVSRTKATTSLRGLQVARGFRFSANDFLTDGQRLVLLDPPHLRRFDLIHRDLSSFTFEVERTLRMSGGSPDHRQMSESIKAAFLRAYEQELEATAGWNWNPGPGRGHWALNFYELSRIAGMAFNHVRAARLGRAMSALAWAWDRRRELGQTDAA